MTPFNPAATSLRGAAHPANQHAAALIFELADVHRSNMLRSPLQTIIHQWDHTMRANPSHTQHLAEFEHRKIGKPTDGAM